MPKPRLPRETRSCARQGCDQTFEVRLNAADANRHYCSRQCARQVENQARSVIKQREWLDSSASLCPCGVNRIPYEVRHTTKYCSAECRVKYGKKKQRDPENWTTFECQNCGKTVEVRKSFGYQKYCSNACAQRHTKVKRHVVLKDTDVVLDNSWEALFWGLCGFLKVSVERFDREHGVEWDGGQWYAPDFWLPFDATAVEIKGQPDEHDEERWATFREIRALTVVDREMMDRLRMARNQQEFELILF